MAPAHEKKLHLLLVEDNLADAELVKVILSSLRPDVLVHCLNNGLDAHDFLFKVGTYAQNPIFPNLVLLDLNLPKKDGKTLLKEMKADQRLCKIPVAILSTSSGKQDVSDCYCLGASVFLTKPLNLGAFEATLDVLLKLYFEYARLATIMDA